VSNGQLAVALVPREHSGKGIVFDRNFTQPKTEVGTRVQILCGERLETLAKIATNIYKRKWKDSGGTTPQALQEQLGPSLHNDSEVPRKILGLFFYVLSLLHRGAFFACLPR